MDVEIHNNPTIDRCRYNHAHVYLLKCVYVYMSLKVLTLLTRHFNFKGMNFHNVIIRIQKPSTCFNVDSVSLTIDIFTGAVFKTVP